MSTDAAMLGKVKALLAALPEDDQRELRRYLSDILVTPDEAEAITIASLTDTRSGLRVTYTYRQEHVRCGKANCWCSEGGLGHGPYTYRYWKDKGRLRKEYVRRSDANPRSGRRRGARARGSSAESSSGPAPPA